MTTAATPMIIPRSVRAERSLCAQMAAAASFNVSINFMVRAYYGTGDGLVARAGRNVGCRPDKAAGVGRRRGQKGEGRGRKSGGRAGGGEGSGRGDSRNSGDPQNKCPDAVNFFWTYRALFASKPISRRVAIGQRGLSAARASQRPVEAERCIWQGCSALFSFPLK